MSDTFWVAIISAASALLGSLIPQIFTLLTKKNEAQNLTNQRLIDLKIQTLRDALIALADCPTTIHTLMTYNPTVSHTSYDEIITTAHRALYSANRLLAITVAYFPNHLDIFNKMQDSLIKQHDFVDRFSQIKPTDYPAQIKLRQEGESNATRWSAALNPGLELMEAALRPQ
jgi:hypothetical protein